MLIEVKTENGVEQVAAVTATCHTEGCGNAGVPIAIPAAYGDQVVCGVCHAQITDITSTGTEMVTGTGSTS